MKNSHIPKRKSWPLWKTMRPVWGEVMAVFTSLWNPARPSQNKIPHDTKEPRYLEINKRMFALAESSSLGKSHKPAYLGMMHRGHYAITVFESGDSGIDALEDAEMGLELTRVDLCQQKFLYVHDYQTDRIVRNPFVW
jgi:hypothetical protein